jgi:uncharacterized protein YhfF
VVPPVPPPPSPAEIAAATGHTVVGAFAFGDSPALADRLLAYVTDGAKRATVESVAELTTLDDPFPEAGQRWGLLDGAGTVRAVSETVEVTIGSLSSVTPAFAWEEGEDDRTHASWLTEHRRYFARQGVADPDGLEVVFERFRLVWPEVDAPRRWADGVRELRWDERAWLRGRVDAIGAPACGTVSEGGPWPPDELPTLVAEDDSGEVVAWAAFLPRPGRDPEVAAAARQDPEGAWTATDPTLTACPALRTGLARLARSVGRVTER